MPEPRFATPRNFDRATYGGHVAALAAAMGTPLLPWQRYVADVSLEIDSEGLFVYAGSTVTVPRQSGKTTLDGAKSMQNALMGPNRFSWYTAQTGQDASFNWAKVADMLELSAIVRPMAKAGSRGIRRSNGSQAIRFLNGSMYAPFPPTKTAMHGKQGDHHTVDEAWAFTAAEGNDIRQGIGPTTSTRRMVTGQRAQLDIYSTEGTIESTFLNPILDSMRAGAEPNVAGFDWGLRPGEDPTDLELVAMRHPAYGHILDMQTLIDQQQLFKDSPGEFARAFGNVRTGATERVIPVDPWRAAAWADELPTGRVCFGAAVGIDGLDGAISVAVRHGDATFTAIVTGGHGIGEHWMIDRMLKLNEKHKAPFVIDRRGPSAGLADRAERAGLELLKIDSGGVSAAHSAVLGGITAEPQPTWRYRHHSAMDAAAELATRRYFQDGAWVFGRRASVGSIAALEAPALAAWGADHLPVEVGIQLF